MCSSGVFSYTEYTQCVYLFTELKNHWLVLKGERKKLKLQQVSNPQMENTLWLLI